MNNKVVGFSLVNEDELMNVDGGLWREAVCTVALFLVMYAAY